MIIRAQGLFLLIAVLLALDSLLKVGIGSFNLQAGLFILLLFGAARVFKSKSAMSILRKDKALLSIVVYTAAHIFFAKDFLVYMGMVTYLLIFLVGYCGVASTANYRIDWRMISQSATMVLITTGFLQYLTFKLFGVQLALGGIGVEHYHGDFGFSERMRGFFVEPNWYGLSLFCWSYLYATTTKKINVLFIVIIALTILCLVLSGNRLIFLIGLISVVGLWISRAKRRAGLSFLPLLFVMASSLIFAHFSMNPETISDRSLLARTFTAGNVVEIFNESSLLQLLLGYGHSNWGYYSNALGLSWSNPFNDQSLMRRDNAEIYVVFFEMGLIGLALYALDLWLLGRKAAKIGDAVFVSCIYVAAILYPIYQFLPYLLPLLVIRSQVILSNENTAFNK